MPTNQIPLQEHPIQTAWMLLSSPSRQSIPRGTGLNSAPIPSSLQPICISAGLLTHTASRLTPPDKPTPKPCMAQAYPTAALHNPRDPETSKCAPTCLHFHTALQPHPGLRLPSPAFSEVRACSLDQNRNLPPPALTPPIPA